MDIGRELNENPAKFFSMNEEILRILRTWKFADLSYGDGPERMKQQLLEATNRFVSKGKILRVLFKELLFGEYLPTSRLPSN